MPIPEYFAKIEACFAEMPTQQKMQGMKRLGKKWQRRYARLVNAFGWSHGHTGRLAKATTRLREEHAEDDGEAVAGELLVAADAEEGYGEGASLASSGEEPMEEELDPADPIDPLIERFLRVWQQSRNAKLVCGRRNNGGQTKGFKTLGELYLWVWSTEGVGWREEFMLKNA